MHSSFGFTSGASAGARMMQAMGGNAARVMFGDFRKTGERSFLATQNAGYSETFQGRTNIATPALLSGYIRLTEDPERATHGNHACSFAETGNKPLKCIYIIEIYQGSIEDMCRKIKPAIQQKIYRKLIASTVIHEVGHGIGIRHHWRQGLENDSLVKVEPQRVSLTAACVIRVMRKIRGRGGSTEIRRGIAKKGKPTKYWL